jgi:uridine kinase
VTEPHVESYAALAARVLDAPPQLGPVRLVAVDGFAGSGKTTFAGRLGDALGAQVLHTDDLLEGWTDLVSFWPRLEAWVLTPLRSGQAGRYCRYDWVREEFAEWHDVPVAPALVLEGVSSARSAIRRELTLSVWVDAPRDLRLARGIARDGESMLPLWEAWQIAEDDHEAGDHTRSHADLVVDGNPRTAHDPTRQFVRAPRIP